MTVPVTEITPTGVVVPAYSDVYSAIQNLYWGIYGTDAVLSPSTQDGQFIAIFAQAISDLNQSVAVAYLSYQPTYAQGAGLSSIVKINGIQRDIATYSQIAVIIVGIAGTEILNGAVGDNAGLGQIWALPPSVIIPFSGTVTVTATATLAGSIPAGNNSLTVILTPTFGWQTVTNSTNEPSLGAPVESDAALRQRQSQSVSLPAVSPRDAIYAAVANVPGVIDLILYDNDTGSPDGNGVPAHSICLVVEGGDVTAVATAVFDKKGPGTGTYGSTSVVVIDQNGVPDTINFYELAFTQIYVTLTITPGTGYTSAVGNAVVASIVATINALAIGTDVSYGDLIAAAALVGQPGYGTFTINVSLFFSGTAPSPAGQTDIAIAFNFKATSVAAFIDLVVT